MKNLEKQDLKDRIVEETSVEYVGISQTMKLRREIFNKVLDGSKKSTSRKGCRDIHNGALKLVMTEDESKIIIVDVINVKTLTFSEFDLQEAKLEGYETLEELRQTLTRIYGKVSEDDIFTIIEWR